MTDPSFVVVGGWTSHVTGSNNCNGDYSAILLCARGGKRNRRGNNNNNNTA